MPYRRNYRRTVAEVIDPRATYRPAALRAVRAFRREKAWRGSVEERILKIGRLNQALAEAYGIPSCRLQFVRIGATSGNGFYEPATHTIGLVGRMSVVTFLHEFAHARGMDERRACRWSINLFRRLFPHSFARCTFDGHMIRTSH